NLSVLKRSKASFNTVTRFLPATPTSSKKPRLPNSPSCDPCARKGAKTAAGASSAASNAFLVPTTNTSSQPNVPKSTPSWPRTRPFPLSYRCVANWFACGKAPAPPANNCVTTCRPGASARNKAALKDSSSSHIVSAATRHDRPAKPRTKSRSHPPSPTRAGTCRRGQRQDPRTDHSHGLADSNRPGQSLWIAGGYVHEQVCTRNAGAPVCSIAAGYAGHVGGHFSRALQSI